MGGKCYYKGSQISLISTNIGFVINCPANCQQCSIDNNDRIICLKTSIGFNFNSTGSIVLCNTICKTCSSSNSAICTSCYNSYRLINGDCKICADPHCLDCSDNQNICAICALGYTTNKGICAVCAENCLSCNLKGPGKCDPLSC